MATPTAPGRQDLTISSHLPFYCAGAREFEVKEPRRGSDPPHWSVLLANPKWVENQRCTGRNGPAPQPAYDKHRERWSICARLSEDCSQQSEACALLSPMALMERQFWFFESRAILQYLAGMAVEFYLKNATNLAPVQWSEGRTAGVRLLGRLEPQVL